MTSHDIQAICFWIPFPKVKRAVRALLQTIIDTEERVQSLESRNYNLQEQVSTLEAALSRAQERAQMQSEMLSQKLMQGLPHELSAKLVQELPIGITQRLIPALSAELSKELSKQTSVAELKSILSAVEKSLLQRADRESYEIKQSFASLQEKLSTAQLEVSQRTRKNSNSRLIISLSSSPQRINTLDLTLYSLFNQNLLADKVVLWLAQDEFPEGEKDVPARVLSFKEKGLEIFFCDNLRAYKKLIPSLSKYEDDIIVTANDDVFYDSNWLRLLYDAYEAKPECCHAHSARKISLTESNELTPYTSWQIIKTSTEEQASFTHFFTGNGGVLYPPHVFHKDVTNRELFEQLSPDNDDLWFWAMLVLKGTKINVVENNISEPVDLGIDDSWEKILSTNKGANDPLIKNVLQHYPEIMEKLIEDTSQN